MTLPKLTESAIRSRASSQSFRRGESYLNADTVGNIIWRGDENGLLSAEVYGSDYEPYEVQISFIKNNIASTSCSCPYDMGGDCKHVVATLLSIIHAPDEIDERPAIETLIDGLNKEQFSWLVRMLAERHSEIADSIEALTAQISNAPSRGSSSAAQDKPQSEVIIPPINEKVLRRQIKADMRGAIQTGYDGWGEETWYESDLSVALEPVLSQIRLLIKAQKHGEALSLLEIATDAWEDGSSAIDEYFYEYFDDNDGAFLSDLNQAWTEALLRAELPSEERLSWANKLEEWSEDIFCGGGLAMAARAAQDGWAYPPLVAAMAGNITELGAWEDGQSPYFADELAQIRLDILEEKGELQAALHLAEAEGQYIRFLQLLVKLGKSERAIAETKEMLSRPNDIHTIAKTLFEVEEIQKAFELGQYGLSLTKPKDHNDYGSWGFSEGKADLAAWLRDAAQEHDPELALKIAQDALQIAVNLPNYNRVQEVAGGQWEALKPQMLSMVKKTSASEGKLDIYLHEKMHKEATQVVDALPYFHDFDKVFDAVQEEFPEWAFRQCAKQAEGIMDSGKAKYYESAADWLRRGRDILRPASLDSVWDSYIKKTMDKHQRKYKLIPMLKNIA